jgi:hypothetical protein
MFGWGYMRNRYPGKRAIYSPALLGGLAGLRRLPELLLGAGLLGDATCGRQCTYLVLIWQYLNYAQDLGRQQWKRTKSRRGGLFELA